VEFSIYNVRTLYLNRCAVFNVLTDKNITNRSIAEKLEIKETEWSLIDSLIKVLKPINLTITVLCAEKHSKKDIRIINCFFVVI